MTFLFNSTLFKNILDHFHMDCYIFNPYQQESRVRTLDMKRILLGVYPIVDFEWNSNLVEISIRPRTPNKKK